MFALVSLENEKFYIGVPRLVPPPDEESIASNSISILPVLSGFREKEEKSLKFVTTYDFRLSKEGTSDHNYISIPRDKIISVSGFTFSTYSRLNKKKFDGKIKRMEPSYFRRKYIKKKQG